MEHTMILIDRIGFPQESILVPLFSHIHQWSRKRHSGLINCTRHHCDINWSRLSPLAYSSMDLSMENTIQPRPDKTGDMLFLQKNQAQIILNLYLME